MSVTRGQTSKGKMATEGEDIKSHLFKLFSTDRDLISKIAEALSSTIVDLVIKSEEFINVVTEKLVKDENIIESVVNKIGESAKQEVYESLSYDQKCLEEKYSELNAKLEKLVADLEKNRLKQIDELDSINQYGRRNCILIHGAAEVKGEDTDHIAVNLFNTKLNIPINKSDLDRSHRLNTKKRNQNRPRPIIVKFSSYNKRAEVFKVKRRLKGSGVSLSESLTAQRQQLLDTVRNNPAVATTWTLDGRIICLLNGSQNKIIIEHPKDLVKLPPTK
jgi:hypothetical protein